MPPVAIEVADVLARFSAPRRIGGGGQKLVFVASDPNIGQIVVKIGGYRSPQALERARREVQTLSSFASQYYPRQFGFEIIDDNRYVIREEFLNGQPLSELLTSFTAEPALLILTRHLVCALDELWRRRIVHRDIKPGNILITAYGPRIIDLGIARLLDASSLTHSYAPIGPCTPPYASPEQLRNMKRDIDHRSDQFSLGIVLAQLALAGTHPFDPQTVGGDSIPENIVHGRWAKAELAGRLSLEFTAIIARLLAPEPYMRYRTGEVLMSSISRLEEVNSQ